MPNFKAWVRKRFGHDLEEKKKHDDEENPEINMKELKADRNLSSSFHEHQMTSEELSENFPDSNINVDKPKDSSGLSVDDAKARLEKDGPNKLKPVKEMSNWMLLLQQFLNLFWLLMIGAGVLSLITYILDTTQPLNLYVSLVLFSITILMCLISFWEEKQARQAVRGFENLIPKQCSVIRDGEECEINAEELVVGDLAFIRSGTQVPADIRLLSCNELKLDNSSITGEAEPVEYTNEPADKSVSVFESGNVAFNGSLCVDGEGLGIVVRTADRTVIGQIASLTTDQKEKTSSLQMEISRFVRFITILALGMATAVFFIGAINSNFNNLLYIVINGFLVIVVANVPEGLPATVTSQLTIIARVMASKNVFLKKLDVIEAFGAATVIASDKTGTLTKNHMTVTDLWYNKQHLAGRPNIRRKMLKAKKSAKNILELYHDPLPDILAVMTVCNNAQMEAADDGIVKKQSYGRVNSKQMLWKPSNKDATESSDNNKSEPPKIQSKQKSTGKSSKNEQTKQKDSSHSDRKRKHEFLKKETGIEMEVQNSHGNENHEQKEEKAKISQKEKPSKDESIVQKGGTAGRKDNGKSKRMKDGAESASSSCDEDHEKKQKLPNEKKQRSAKKQKRPEFGLISNASISSDEDDNGEHTDKKQRSEKKTRKQKTVENKSNESTASDSDDDSVKQRSAIKRNEQKTSEDKSDETDKITDTDDADTKKLADNKKHRSAKTTHVKKSSHESVDSSDESEKYLDKECSTKKRKAKKASDGDSSQSTDSDVYGNRQEDSKQQSIKATKTKKTSPSKSDDSMESDGDSEKKEDTERSSEKRKVHKSAENDSDQSSKAERTEPIKDEKEIIKVVFKDDVSINDDDTNEPKNRQQGKGEKEDEFEESQPKDDYDDEKDSEEQRKRKTSDTSSSSSRSSKSESSDSDDESEEAPSGHKLAQQMSIETSSRKHISGSPSEVALLRYAAYMVDLHYMRNRYKVVFEIPFNSLRKWHLVIAKLVNEDDDDDKNNSYILMMKGAAEMLIKMCSTYAIDGEEEDVDDEFQSDFDEMYHYFGNEGRRVIGFVCKTFEAPADTRFTMEDENYPQDDLCFLGMAAIMDPPRDDTAKAIASCKSAGIKVFMVTGDHPFTAAAIARQIGLIGKADEVKHHRKKIHLHVNEDDDMDSAIVHGESLQDMTSEEWDELLKKKGIVFARTTPELKLLIVEECQKRGEIVAVTGDGVNDAPALKKANIGIAMGGIGSEVAKQAASIVLMDDNFASIVRGIEEGRRLYDNLKKTIAYTLTHWLPEVFPVVMYFTFGFPQALTSLQILSIDLGSELPPAISLAYEGTEKDIMQKPPRKRTNRLVGWGLLAYAYIFAGGIITIGCTLAYLTVYWCHGISAKDLIFTANSDHWKSGAKNFTSNGASFTDRQQLRIMAEAGAAYHITLVMSQVFHLWMCTTRRQSFFRHGITNYVCIFAVLIEVLMVNLFAYTPGVQYLMGTSAPPYQIWYFCVGVGIVLWVYNESRKYFIRHYPKNRFVRLIKW